MKNLSKFKLILIGIMFLLFSVFIGIQVSSAGTHSFFAGFIITLLYSLVVFLIMTVLYIIGAGKLISKNKLNPDNYQSPYDIWLISLPFCVLLVVSFLWLEWQIADVYYCTTLAISGMLLGNALGRGSGKWHIIKSLPFFSGTIFSILFGIIMDWMV